MEAASTCCTYEGVVANSASYTSQLSTALVDAAVCDLIETGNDQCHVTPA